MKCQHKDLGPRALPDKDQDSFPRLGAWDPDQDPVLALDQAGRPAGAPLQVEERI